MDPILKVWSRLLHLLPALSPPPLTNLPSVSLTWLRVARWGSSGGMETPHALAFSPQKHAAGVLRRDPGPRWRHLHGYFTRRVARTPVITADDSRDARGRLLRSVWPQFWIKNKVRGGFSLIFDLIWTLPDNSSSNILELWVESCEALSQLFTNIRENVIILWRNFPSSSNIFGKYGKMKYQNA